MRIMKPCCKGRLKRLCAAVLTFVLMFGTVLYYPENVLEVNAQDTYISINSSTASQVNDHRSYDKDTHTLTEYEGSGEEMVYKPLQGEDGIPVSIAYAASITNGDNTTNYETIKAATDAWSDMGGGTKLTLLRDWETTGSVSVKGGTSANPKVLDLNGHGILNKGISTDGSPAIFVNEGTFLEIKDSSSTETHYVSRDSAGRATGVSDNSSDGAIEVTGGYIAGGYKGTKSNGGGIWIDSKSGSASGLTMTGGTIIGNLAEYGGGVYVTENSSFIMTGGTIKYNTATKNGGAICFLGNTESVTYPDGTIKDNSGTQILRGVKLSYDANGGSGNLPETEVCVPNSQVIVRFFTGISKYGYTFKEWNARADGSGEGYYIAEGSGPSNDLLTITAPTVLYAKWTPNSYKVIFDANCEDAGGSMIAQDFVFDTAQQLTGNGFTRTNYTFAGWAQRPDGEVVYKDQQSVKNLAPSGEVTLYAVWFESGNSISGIVKQAGSPSATPVSGVNVELVRGDVQYGTAITDTDGKYTFEAVPAGTYNIIAVKGNDATDENYRKMTALVEVKSNRPVDDIILPEERVNSVIDVEAGTPAVMVGELDEVAKDEKVNDHKVIVTMTVQTKTSADAETAAIKEMAERDSASDAVELDYFDIKVEKTVDDTTTTTLGDTGHVIEMIVPFNFKSRKNVGLFRYHGTNVDSFTELSARPEKADFRDASFYADHENSRVYIYGSKFSTYAISYETASMVTVIFIKNDTTGDAAQQTIALGKEKALDANTFTRSDYSFSKWNTEADGSGVDYSNGQNVTLYKDLTLYAQWVQNPPAPTYDTVTFELGGHGTAISPKSVKSGTTLTRPDDPVAEGFIFGGWYRDAACTVAYDFTQPVNKSFILYAKWTAGDASVSLNSISITTAPAKTSYKEGELFDPAGMVVTASYTDGSSKAVTGYTYSPDGVLSINDNKITVSYTESGISCTASQSIIVKANGGDEPDPAAPIPGSGEARDSQPKIKEGETLYLVKGQSFTLAKGWSCKDKKLLSVSKKGVAKAKNTGNITLVYGNNEKTIDVCITAPTITSKIPSLPVGTSQEIALNCDAHLPVLWYSAAPNIATVDQAGNVTGHSKGTAKVTAMINGKAYNCSVKVVEEKSLPERDLYLNVKSTKTVKIKGLKKTVWTISGNEAEGSGLVKLSGAKIKGLKPGDVQLFCEGYVLNVHVEDPAIAGSAKPYKMTLNMKAGEVSEGPVTLPNVEQDVVFKSNKCSVAYIYDSGLIHARSKGIAKITAKINGKTVTITVKVKDAVK